jgi:hypothetical protein
MRMRDGREVLVLLALPLPITIVTDLMEAVAEVAASHGYTDLVLMMDGTGGLVGTPPTRTQAARPE